MDFLAAILYGLVSGIAEILPISATGHQTILLKLLGAGERDPLMDFFVHAAILAAIWFACRGMIRAIRRERQSAFSGNGRSPYRDTRHAKDARLVRTAAFPMLIGMLLLLFTRQLESNLFLVSLFLILNGVMLFLPDRMTGANKDSLSMSAPDAILMGLAASLCVFPGISRIGAATSAAAIRGADRQHGLNWALLLSIPALAFLLVFDMIAVIQTGIGSGILTRLPGYIFAAASAGVAGYYGISMMRFLTYKLGFSGFAYYSWGAGLFLFILYLQV